MAFGTRQGRGTPSPLPFQNTMGYRPMGDMGKPPAGNLGWPGKPPAGNLGWPGNNPISGILPPHPPPWTTPIQNWQQWHQLRQSGQIPVNMGGGQYWNNKPPGQPPFIPGNPMGGLPPGSNNPYMQALQGG